MPLYNKEAEVGRAVRSVLNQSVQDFELVVVNDGSTDRSPEIVRSFQDRRIKVIDQANAGVSAARNRGIGEADADLIAFLDADDEWMPDFLETVLRLQRTHPACSVFATGYLLCRKDGLRSKAIVRGLPGGFEEGILSDYFVVAAHSDPPLCASGVAVTRAAIASVGGFPEGVSAGEDLLTWARLASRYLIVYSASPKACFWEPMGIADRPGRMPQNPDKVGEELVRILSEIPTTRIKGMKEYIALWHRMRAVIYLQFGEWKNALSELKKAAVYTHNLKVYLLMVIAALPFHPAGRLISTWRRFRKVF